MELQRVIDEDKREQTDNIIEFPTYRKNIKVKVELEPEEYDLLQERKELSGFGIIASIIGGLIGTECLFALFDVEEPSAAIALILWAVCSFGLAVLFEDIGL